MGFDDTDSSGSDITAPGQLQTAPGAPTSSNLSSSSQPLLIPRQTDSRFQHFPPETYDLNPHSNLVRYLRTILGDAGTGQLRKRLVLARLGQLLASSHFYDLDTFYGALFGIQRTPSEELPINPYTDTATSEQWRTAAQLDSSYRQRLFQFGRAIGYGPTPIGMQLIAEALLNIPCDIYESYIYADQQAMTYTQLQSYTYNQLQAFTYDQLDGMTGEVPNSLIRKQFIIAPHRAISVSESFDLQQVISRIKPADALFQILQNGSDVYQPVALQGCWSDSNYWEIAANTTVSAINGPNPYNGATPGTTIGRQSPPFTSYQGEQWFYNNDITGSLSYVEAFPGNVIQSTDAQRIVWKDGTYTDYLPSNAPMPWWQTILGRYAQDGVMAINGVSGRASLNSPVGLSDLYFDGFSAGELLATLGQPPGASGLLTGTGTNSFWATDAKDQTNNEREILELRFGSIHTVNSISFDVSHFPTAITLEYYNVAIGLWVPLLENAIYDSVPATLSRSQDYLVNKTHPQHYGTDHWYTVATKIAPTDMQRFRIVLERGRGTAPQVTTAVYQPNAAGDFSIISNPVPYSLAIRNIRVAYSIESEQDLPVINLPDQQVIGQGADILGSPVAYSLYQEDPNDALSIDTNQWRSNPQPINNAVVNFYADTRNELGNAQTIDRFYVDPTHLGVHATLYYSNDTPEAAGTHTAQDTPLDAAALIVGNLIDTPSGLQFPSNVTSPGYIDVSNQAIQWDPTQDWWLGIGYQALVAPTAGTVPIIDVGGSTLGYTNGAFVLTPADGSPVMTQPIPLPTNSTVEIVIGHSAANGWVLAWEINGTPSAAYASSRLPGMEMTTGRSYSKSSADLINSGSLSRSIVTGALTRTETFSDVCIGGFLDGSTPAASGMLLKNLVLKGEAVTDSTIDGFFANASPYCAKGDFRSQDLGLTANAHLRFDQSFVSISNPSGLVGGPPGFYPDLSWTAIPGDYLLTTGYLAFAPTQAKFWKVEMTNLVAEPFEGFLPIQQQVQTFPRLASTALQSPIGWQGPIEDGILTLSTLAANQPMYPYSGTPPVFAGTTPPATTSPADVLISTDPAVAQQLANQSWLYNFASYHQGQDAPRFTLPGQHVYQQSDVTYSNKVAFFCGFKTFQAFRSSVIAQDDTRIYQENFLDDFNIYLNGFEQNPGDLATPTIPAQQSLLPMVAQSIAFRSTHDVIGLQFATQQSDPQQVVTDDDMRNPALVASTWTGTDTWHGLGDVVASNLNYNAGTNSIIISRQAQAPPAAEGSGGGLHGLIEPPVEPVLETLNLTSLNPGAAASQYGGIGSGSFLLSPRGRAYVAVRYTPLSPLSSPLYVQLINSLSGRVIWEEATTGPTGAVTEFYASYDIGSVPNTDPTASLYVALVQKGKSNDIISVDTLSVFDEGIIWEFSVDGGVSFWQSLDTRNNSNGVLSFPNGGQELVWRVTAYRENMHINSLQMRPIYTGQLAPDQEPFMRGPNLSTFDLTPDIYSDPLYNDWTRPVPRWWFLAFKQYSNLFPDGVPIITQYAQFYNRVQNENLASTLHDAATAMVIHNPISIEFLGIHYPMTDAANWNSGHFTRATSDDVSQTFGDGATFFVTTPAKFPAIISPPIHRDLQ